MPYKVLKYDIVDEEIEAIINYYNTISLILGKKVEDEILTTLYKLVDFPEHYSFVSDGIHRRIPVRNFPYMFVYKIQGASVIVKILFPQKNDPAKLWDRLIGK